MGTQKLKTPEDLKSEAMSEKIVEFSQAKNFIPVHFTDHSPCEISYLELISLGKTKNEFSEDSPFSATPGIDYGYTEELTLKPLKKYVSVGSDHIEMSITQDEITKIRDIHNIDALLILDNQSVIEMAQRISQLYIKRIGQLADKNADPLNFKDKTLTFLYKLVKREYIKTIEIKDERQLINKIIIESNKTYHKTRRGPATFVICSMKTATMIQENSQYTFSTPNTVLNSNGCIYPIGQIANIKMYVDPNLRWTDHTVIVGRTVDKTESGIHLVFKENGTSTSLRASGAGAQSTMLYTEYSLVDVGAHPEYNYTKFVWKSKKELL